MDEIRAMFEEQTGVKAIIVTQLGVGVYTVEAEDGNIYIVK